MSEENRTKVASLSVNFFDDTNATLDFEINKDIPLPTTKHLKVIALATVFTELVSALLTSDGLLSVNDLVEHAFKNESLEEEIINELEQE